MALPPGFSWRCLAISSSPSKSDFDSNDEIKSPQLSLAGWSRWIWRQLTSMKTALLLLLLLAVAAVPGSVFPQRSADPNGVTAYFDNNPGLAPILDAVQLFDVYTSAWFSAIYILLFISLIGCVLPRTAVHFKALRSAPVDTPRLLSRMPAHLKVSTSAKLRGTILDSAAALLKKQGYRVQIQAGADDKPASVSAERGYLRETGNLVFHLSLIGVL
ncbi:MAG: hypothetical protein RLZZ590_804, partial [Actinomycetota bacterium]